MACAILEELSYDAMDFVAEDRVGSDDGGPGHGAFGELESLFGWDTASERGAELFRGGP